MSSCVVSASMINQGPFTAMPTDAGQYMPMANYPPGAWTMPGVHYPAGAMHPMPAAQPPMMWSVMNGPMMQSQIMQPGMMQPRMMLPPQPCYQQPMYMMMPHGAMMHVPAPHLTQQPLLKRKLQNGRIVAYRKQQSMVYPVIGWGDPGMVEGSAPEELCAEVQYEAPSTTDSQAAEQHTYDYDDQPEATPVTQPRFRSAGTSSGRVPSRQTQPQQELQPPLRRSKPAASKPQPQARSPAAAKQAAVRPKTKKLQSGRSVHVYVDAGADWVEEAPEGPGATLMSIGHEDDYGVSTQRVDPDCYVSEEEEEEEEGEGEGVRPVAMAGSRIMRKPASRALINASLQPCVPWETPVELNSGDISVQASCPYGLFTGILALVTPEEAAGQLQRGNKKAKRQ